MINFSIITVCLNEKNGIRRTCESICCQNSDSFEWIVIDGQSTDGTLEILEEYKSRISHIISEQDSGIYDAMNKGIQLAKGEYLLFLNAGDFFYDNDVLSFVSKFLNKDILYGDLECVVEGSGGFVKSFPDHLPKHFLLKNMMPHQSSFFRRTLFEEYGKYDTSFRIAGDYDLFVRMLYLHKVSSCHIRRTLAVFSIGGISSSPVQRFLRKKENHFIRKKYFPWHVYGFRRLKEEIRLKFNK